MLNPWLALSFQAARVGWQAQNAIALRFMRMVAGSAWDQSEGHRVAENLKAPTQSAAMPVAIKGSKGRSNGLKKVFKKHASGNKGKRSK